MLSSSLPFDNLKDLFSNIANKKKEKVNQEKRQASAPPKEESKGFKYGDFKVFSSSEVDDDDGEVGTQNKNGRRQQYDVIQWKVEVEIIDAET